MSRRLFPCLRQILIRLVMTHSVTRKLRGVTCKCDTGCLPEKPPHASVKAVLCLFLCLFVNKTCFHWACFAFASPICSFSTVIEAQLVTVCGESAELLSCLLTTCYVSWWVKSPIRTSRKWHVNKLNRHIRCNKGSYSGDWRWISEMTFNLWKRLDDHIKSRGCVEFVWTG